MPEKSITATDLKDWFKNVGIILFESRVALENLKRLTFPEDGNDVKIIEGNGFFRLHRRQCWFIVTVQLAKVVSESRNQHFNIFRFFDRLQKNHFDDSVLNLLSENQNKGIEYYSSPEQVVKHCQYLRECLAKQKTVEAIEHVIDYRDKVYAHTDSVPSTLDLYLIELDSLCEIIYGIYFELRNNFGLGQIDQTNNDFLVDPIIEQFKSSKHD